MPTPVPPREPVASKGDSVFMGINLVVGELPVGTAGVTVTYTNFGFSFGEEGRGGVAGGKSVLFDVSTSRDAE